MITLQSTFEYFDTATPPVDQVEIDIKYPRLSLKTPEGGPKTFAIDGHGALGFAQSLARKDYPAGTATAKIFGPDFGKTLEEFFIPHVSSATQSLKLADLTTLLSVNFGDGEAGDSDKKARNRVRGAVTVTLAAFDNSEVWSAVWSGVFKAKDPALQRLDIVVYLKLPGTIYGGPAAVGGDSGQSGSAKLRGKVVSLAKSCTLAGTIVIQARKVATGPWITVATGKSEKAGISRCRIRKLGGGVTGLMA